MRSKLRDVFRTWQPILLILHGAISVLADACVGPLSNIAVQIRFVPRLQVWILHFAKHIPSGHSWVQFLIGVRHVIILVNGSDVIGKKFIIAVALFLIGVVVLVIYFCTVGAIGFQSRVPATDVLLKVLFNSVLLGSVKVLCAFFLRVP